ncbi:MAG: hypothetical protein SFY80_07865 [Verrucomicrobiota bacterium]|nr:hypothetical protein [Verrucomicrobiota bacterium]
MRSAELINQFMIHKFHEARASLRKHLLDSGATHHMFYGPTTDRYWNEPFKVVAVNMEPYGYEKMGVFDVTRDDLIDWIYDAGDTGTKTTRYTFAVLHVALACFQKKIAASREMLSAAFANDDMIEDTLDRTIYYNIRAQSNSVKPQDYAAISAVGHSDTGRYIWAEIMALRPDVVFVGGHAGLAAVNQLLSPQGPIGFRNSAVVDGCLIYSIPHPSRPAYDAWCLAINNTLNWMNEK